jgi:hypothetical protein
MKIDVWTILLIGVGLLWVIGVDFMPFLRVLGFPMFIGVFTIWVNKSSVFKRLSEFMDDGLAGKYE